MGHIKRHVRSLIHRTRGERKVSGFGVALRLRMPERYVTFNRNNLFRTNTPTSGESLSDAFIRLHVSDSAFENEIRKGSANEICVLAMDYANKHIFVSRIHERILL